MTIGEYIKQRRKELHLTQPSLASKLKTFGKDRDWSTIAAWETGKNPVPIDVIPALSLALEEKSPNKLYDLMGVLENIAGADILKLLADSDSREISAITQLVEFYLKNKSE